MNTGTIFNVLLREDEIRMFQHSDEALARKISILKKDKKDQTRREIVEVKYYNLQDGLLYKVINREKRYVIPKAMRKAIVIKNQSHRFLCRMLICKKKTRETGWRIAFHSARNKTIRNFEYRPPWPFCFVKKGK